MSSRFMKKSLVNDPFFFVKTPILELSKLVSKTRSPPIKTVISGAVNPIKLALSRSFSSADVIDFLLER